MTNSEYLIEAGKIFPGVKVCESPNHPLLMDLAQKHSQYMAKVQRLGHQNFQSRYELIKDMLDMGASEIAAMSWFDDPQDLSLNKVAEEMYKSWRSSAGHWKVASVKHAFAGYGMEKGLNGIWYSTILTAD